MLPSKSSSSGREEVADAAAAEALEDEGTNASALCDREGATAERGTNGAAEAEMSLPPPPPLVNVAVAAADDDDPGTNGAAFTAFGAKLPVAAVPETPPSPAPPDGTKGLAPAAAARESDESDG